jgi:hypothetical protein
MARAVKQQDSGADIGCFEPSDCYPKTGSACSPGCSPVGNSYSTGYTTNADCVFQDGRFSPRITRNPDSSLAGGRLRAGRGDQTDGHPASSCLCSRFQC